MPIDSIPDPLSRYLQICCNPNSAELLDQLPDVMTNRVTPEVAAQFRRQLAHAINHSTITPDLYKALTTDNEYTTQEQVQDRMVEIWRTVYGAAPIVE